MADGEHRSSDFRDPSACAATLRIAGIVDVWAGVVLSAMALIFLIDLLGRSQIPLQSLHALAVLGAFSIHSRLSPFLVASVATFLIVLGYIYSARGSGFTDVNGMMNATTGLLLIWGTWGLGSRLRRMAAENLDQDPRLRVLLDGLKDYAIVLLDREGRIVVWSRGAEAMFGYSEEEVRGQPIQRMVVEDHATGERQRQEMDQAVAEGRWEREAWRTHKNGTRFRANIVLEPLFWRGQLDGFAEVTRDLTERQRSEEQMRSLLDDLRRSNSDLEQFAYVASHDLQEPLRGVSGFVQLIRKRYHGNLDAQADQWIEMTIRAAERMQMLINDLLAYSRVGSKGKTFQAVDCQEVIDLALAGLSTVIEESGAEVTTGPLPVVQGDRGQLTQLFQNLIGNSIKFRGEATPTIHISAESLGDEWLFQVRDNGMGIEPEYRERVFVIFQRLHTRQAYPGSGIGLSICKKIVERHGGRIWIESEPNRGTTVLLTLPSSGRDE